MPHIKIPAATPKQQEYIEQLAIDLSLGRRARNAHISSVVNRQISYLDELTLGEASNVIEIFKRWKENDVTPALRELREEY